MEFFSRKFQIRTFFFNLIWFLYIKYTTRFVSILNFTQLVINAWGFIGVTWLIIYYWHLRYCDTLSREMDSNLLLAFTFFDITLHRHEPHVSHKLWEHFINFSNESYFIVLSILLYHIVIKRTNFYWNFKVTIFKIFSKR